MVFRIIVGFVCKVSILENQGLIHELIVDLEECSDPLLLPSLCSWTEWCLRHRGIERVASRPPHLREGWCLGCRDGDIARLLRRIAQLLWLRLLLLLLRWRWRLRLRLLRNRRRLLLRSELVLMRRYGPGTGLRLGLGRHRVERRPLLVTLTHRWMVLLRLVHALLLLLLHHVLLLLLLL